MGFMMDQLRKRLKKKQEASNAAKAFKRIPRKDITFLPANYTATQISEFVNTRTLQLISAVGGEDKYVEGDFSVEYIDRTSVKDYIKKEEHSLESNISKENTGGWNSDNTELDWESKNVEITTELAEGLNIDSLQFYMIIIEYTEMKEVA